MKAPAHVEGVPTAAPAVRSRSDRSLVVVAAATIFLGAFLLFQVQPIVAKAILPRFGGSAAVWTTCMLFFQGMLLAGYLYAHASVTFLSPVWQRRVHVGLLLAALLVLPITPGPATEALARLDPAVAILVTLASCVGLPYFLLSTTGPLLQAWVTQWRPGAVPYRLFALSNLASLLGLLTYPLLVEPFASLRQQAVGWSWAFAAFAACCAALAWRGVDSATRAALPQAPARSAAPRALDWVLWVALAACPSVLLLAVTNHLTQDIAPIPFLWILPLVLYLLSFILCFEQRSYYLRSVFLPLTAVALLGMNHLLVGDHGAEEKVRWVAPMFALGLFVCCMACHGELARAKPPPDRLTAFYLAVAAGGVLGGVLVGVAAPRVFDGFHELPLGLVATGGCLAAVLARGSGGSRLARAVPLLAALGVTGFLGWGVAGRLAQHVDSNEWAGRNFYGTLRLRDSGEGESAYRSLVHAGTEHGGQFVAPRLRRQATTYYAPESGVGRALLHAQANGATRVGVIGLGAGTLAAYARPGDAYTFYDINPLVVDIARTRFTFLADTAAATSVVLGDARLALERQPPQRFDVLVVDAFSGDAIPIHLLTAQAFAEYLRHLGQGGVLAVHTSNRYLELNPVVKALASHHGRDSVLVENASDGGRRVNAASWILVAPPGHPLLDALADAAEPSYGRLPEARLWTDDYSSVLTVLRALQREK